MRLLVPLGIAGLAVAIGTAHAQPAAVVVREGTGATDGAVIGQRIPLYVDILFAGSMPHPPRVSIPDVAGLQTFRFETQGTTIQERIDGVAYVGQRFEFAVYARRGGTFALPGAEVTLLSASGDPAGTATGSSTTLTVQVPPGVDPSTPVIASNRMTLSEDWSRRSGAAYRAGDAVRRVVHREAEDVPSLAMDPIPAAAPDGVRAYADPPVTEDRIERGTLTGRRTDAITYVFEKPGSYTLPALQLSWWDLRDHALRRESAAGLTVAVAAAAEAAQPAKARDLRRTSLRDVGDLAVGALIAILLAWLTWRLAPMAAASWRNARERRAASEPAAFRRLLETARSGDAGATYRAYLDWRSLLPRTDLSRLQDAVRELEGGLYGPQAARRPWSRDQGLALAADLRTVRTALQQHHAGDRPPTALPPLNPIPPR